MDATDFVNNNQDGIMEVTEKFVSEAYDKIMNRGISLTTKQETEYRLVLVATRVYDNGKTIAYLKLIDKNGSIVATSSEFSGKGGKWGSQINLMGDAALEDKWLSDGDTQLKSGIVRSYLRNCEIGLNSAVYNVALLDGYKLGEMCLVMNVNELVATNPEELKPVPLEVMNENGGRYIYPFAGMTIADATLWARYRGRKQLMEKLESAALQELHSKGLCVIGAGAVVKNSREIKNVAVLSSLQAPSKIYDCTVLTYGVV